MITVGNTAQVLYTAPRPENNSVKERIETIPLKVVEGYSNSQRSSDKTSDKFLSDVIDKVNKSLDASKTSLKFSIHRQTHEVMVRIVNDSTGEVVKEIPSEKALDRAAELMKMSGIILDEKR